MDRYEVIELLGRGGMGFVYRARDPKLARQVALKILTTAEGPAGGARVLREARAVATLSHPNVLAIYDADEATEPEARRGLPYIAMELVIGSSLRAFVGDASIPMARRIGWLRAIADALAAAHEAGIVHRDIKPENVMIRFDDVVKVLDFGIARRHETNESPLASTEGHSLPTIGSRATDDGLVASVAAGPIAGTLSYMAPEQLRGERVDGRTDQFAWAVLAYELLSGRSPWDRSLDAVALIAQILSRDPEPLSTIARNVPPNLASAVMRALAKDPASRFLSMRVLGAEIAGGAAGRARVVALRRAAWVLAGTSLLALGAGSVVARRHPAVAAPSTPVAPAGCTSSAACSRDHGGAAWHCNATRRECVEVASADCRVLSSPGDSTNDDTVWIGGLYPTTGKFAAVSASEPRALDLARQDFAAALGSSASRTDSFHAHPLAVVMCDEAADPVRAANHLADLEVPAVVGFRSTDAALATIPSVFLRAHVLSFIAMNQSAPLMQIPEPAGEPRLVWRSTIDSVAMTTPIAALLSDVLEPRIRGTVKVAVVRRRKGGSDLASALFRALRYNGKSALENGDAFRQYVEDDDAPGPAADVVDALLAFRPDVIFVLSDEFESKVLEPLERRWGAGARPYYLTTSDIGMDMAAWAGKDPDRRRRFFGVTNVSERMANAQLVLRYNQAFPTEPVARATAPQPSYDAFYVLAYAIAALGDEPVTGPSISKAIDRLLPPGPGVEVGPTDILRAFGALRSGGHIDLQGALGALDFDRATGEAPIDYAIVCLGKDDHGAASDSIESGLVYDAAARKLVGTLRCP